MKTWAAIWPRCVVALVFTKVDSCVTFIHICEVKRIWSAICNWTVFDPYTTFLLESGLVGWSIGRWFIQPIVRSVARVDVRVSKLTCSHYRRQLYSLWRLKINWSCFYVPKHYKRTIGQSYPGTAFRRTEADIPGRSCRCSSLVCCGRFDHILRGWPFC